MFSLKFKYWYNNLLESFLLKENASITQIIKNNKDLKNYYNLLKLPAVFDNFEENKKNILKKWISYQILMNNKTLILPQMQHYDVLFDNDYNSEIFRNMNKVDYTEEKLQKDNRKYHENIKQKKEQEYHDDVRDLGLPAINGYKWASLDKKYCSKYGKSMGHCGNVNYANEDNILTLYSVANPKIHYLTFIVNNKVLGESKGRNNDKPDKKFLPNIKQLLLSNYVNCIKGMGYKPENNFNFNDFDKKDKQEILEQKPFIDNYVKYINTLNGTNKLYHIDDDELMFDKNLTDEQFYDICEEIPDKKEHWSALAKEAKNRGLKLPDSIFNIIKAESYYSLVYAAYILHGENVPNEILTGINKNVLNTEQYAKYCIENNLKVPEIIEDRIISSPMSSNKYARLMRNANMQVPIKVLDAIAQAPNPLFDYIEYCLFYEYKVEDIILEKTFKYPNIAIKVFDLYLHKGNIPQSLKDAIAKNPLLAQNASQYLLQSKRPVPKIFLDSIASDIDVSFYFAKFLLLNQYKVPDNILHMAKENMIHRSQLGILLKNKSKFEEEIRIENEY